MHRPELLLDTTKVLGSLKALNGGNMAPPLAGSSMNDISEAYKELRCPYARLHDAPLDNKGWRIVDFNMIFPFMHLDAEDPRNYYFEQTDEYIGNCIRLGTQIVYRLGPSIEHHYPRYNTRPVPREQWDKWADVASNIIRHYNEGWGNGFHFNIKYWEIWNEPEGLWAGPIEDFNEFYCHLAKILKERFPHLKIGGPAHVRCEKEGYAGKFLQCCADHKAPFDFYSWHCYTDNVEFMREQVFYARELVDSYGYPNAELHLNEWHYVPGSWSRISKDQKAFHYEHRMKELDAGAFLTATMTVWQETPLDMANYYTLTCGAFGLFSLFGVPAKSYYCMKAFGKMLDYPDRVQVLSNDRDLYALACKDSSGEIALLISVFHVRGNVITLKSDRMLVWKEVLSVDIGRNLEPLDVSHDEDKNIRINIGTKPSVIFARFQSVEA